MYVDWNVAGAVVIPGLVIIFASQVILALVIMRISRVVNGPRKKPVAKPLDGSQAVDEETAAVISAAVYAYLEEEFPGVSYKIAAIDRAGSVRPAWGFAGIQQNTHPF